MPLNQGRKGRLRGFITASDKLLEQLSIAELTGGPALEKGVQVSRYLSRQRAGHVAVLPDSLLSFGYTCC